MSIRNPLLAAGALTVFLATGLAAAPLFAADQPAPAPQPPQALSPAVQAAIADLGAEDYKTRQDAVKKLELALGEQMRALVSSDDPEIQSRIITLLQFNDGLSRWVADAYKLPPDQRKATLKFGLQPDILPLLALVFSTDADRRVEAAHQLAKIDKPEATELLGRLLNDQDRAVYLAAMEAVWDRKPNDAIVDALWDRAVDAGMNLYRGNDNRNHNLGEQHLKFRGRSLPAIAYYDNSTQRKMQDSDIATDVLVHIKAPQVNARLKQFLDDYDNATSGHGHNVNMWIYSGNSAPMKNALRIMVAYKSPDTLKLLYKIATNPVGQKSQGNVNGQKYFWSNRTTALAALVEALDLKPDDYKLKRQSFLGGVWTVPTEADENDAIKKIQAYWTAHPEILTQKAAPATSAPNTPAATPEPAVQNQPHILIQHRPIQGLQIQITPAPPPPKK